MEKENRFKLFMPPRLSAGQVSAGRSQGSKSLPVSDTISQEVKLCSEVDEENPETMNELFSKLYKEAEKIKQWKLTVETELNQKERKLQENRKIIEAQKKAVQELQFENEKLHLKLEDEICENKDLLKEAAASRHLCNLLKETCTRFAEKTSKYEQEKEATIQLYEELHSNIERMTVAFEELRVQAENDRLEMSFKLKEEAKKVDKFEKECKLEVSQKEKYRFLNELESLKEKMAKTGEEMKSTLDEREENMNNLKKQMENKTKCIEELQQENKVLKKKITAESKKSNTYEGKVNKLQLEMENMNKQHKEEVDMYQKDIETRKVNENKLHEEVEKMRLLCDETAMIQRETDARCQHKITEMMALMEKHKNEYDKMIEEKDAELKVYKMKQQKQFSSERALENELSCLKRELSSLKEQLKAEMEEKVEFFIP
ncbi:synaptonemal complex protein 1-like [Ammospiza maritima maritima]